MDTIYMFPGFIWLLLYILSFVYTIWACFKLSSYIITPPNDESCPQLYAKKLGLSAMVKGESGLAI